MSKLDNCRACGFDHGGPTWEDAGHTPTFEICSCCGAEFGYEDCTREAAMAYRVNWLARGAPWFNERKKPSGWSLTEQLRQVPKDFE